jgi:hypothetical protein
MREFTEDEKFLASALSIHRTEKTGFALQLERVEQYGITQELIEEALNQIQKRIQHNTKKGIDIKHFDKTINQLKFMKEV